MVKIPNVDASRDVQTLVTRIVNVRYIILYPSEFTEFDIGCRYVYNMETSTDKKGTPLRKQDTVALKL